MEFFSGKLEKKIVFSPHYEKITTFYDRAMKITKQYYLLF